MLRVLVLLSLVLASPGLAVDIPKINGVTIDGSADDWKDAGFRIECMGDTGVSRHETFDPRVRLAWDDRGLLMLATVKDGTPKEASDVERMFDGDSVELFVVEEIGKPSRMQILIGPGTTVDQPAVRTHVFDHRQNKPAETAAQVEVAREKIEGGYRVEVRVPWSNFSTPFKHGSECGVQVYVNDLHGTKKSGGAWYPSDETSRDPLAVHVVKLSDRTSEPQTIGMMLSLHRWRTAKVSVRVAPDPKLDGKVMEVISGDSLIGKDRISARRAADTTHLFKSPLSTLETDALTISVRIDGTIVAETVRSRLNKRRMDGFHAQGMSGPFAFSGEAFPEIDFVQANLVEDLVGPYEIERKYYDSEFNEVALAEKPGRYGAIVTVTLQDGSTTRRKFTLYRLEREDTWADVKLEPLPAMPEAFDLESQENFWMGDVFRGGMRMLNNQSEALAIALAGLGEFPGKVERYADDPVMRNDLWWFELEKKIGTYREYPYVEHLPAGYGNSGEEKWPLILFLHGSGERGDDLSSIRNANILNYARKHPDEVPAIVIAPQCPRFERWSPPRVMELLKSLKAKYRIDDSRIYLTGLSMGGFGSWLTATWQPDVFACVAPLCAGGSPRYAHVMKDLPTWAFHGDADRTVPVNRTTEMIDALKAAGAMPKLTIYPKAGHSIWSQTYNDPELYRWMFEQRKK